MTTARSADESADLGGQHFRPLAMPHVALVGGAPSSTSGFGSIWHLVDRELGLPATLLDGSELAREEDRKSVV